MKRHIKTIIKLFTVIVIAAIVFYFWKLAPVKVQTFEVKSSPMMPLQSSSIPLPKRFAMNAMPGCGGSISLLTATHRSIMAKRFQAKVYALPLCLISR